MDKKTIRIALTKGRLEKDTVNLFDKIGYDVSQLRDKGRRLILDIPGSNIEVVLAKAADVLTYVEHGVCDLGVVGKDTIDEHGGRFFEVCDLGFGRCRFALAGKVGNNFYEGCGVKTIATKYPNITRKNLKCTFQCFSLQMRAFINYKLSLYIVQSIIYYRSR